MLKTILHLKRIDHLPLHFLLVFILIAFCMLFSAPSPAAAQEDQSAAQEIIQAINAWRIEQRIWPLRENAILDRMAYDQASYVLSLPSIPEEGAIHLGTFGETPPTRARMPQYDWPSYGGPDYTAIGEIAYVGHSAVTARRFWETSPIHKNTALNSAYREIGVAALPQRFGHLYIVDFGSRPNVLPALADISTHTLYLSNERYFGARAPWIRNVLKVRLFDADGRPLDSDWETWQSQMPLPTDAGDQLFVEYMDSSNDVALASISLASQSDALPTATPGNTPSPTPSSTPSPMLSTTITPSTPGVTVTRGAAPTSTPTFALTVTSAAAPTNNVLLLYDARSFTLINSSQTPINVSQLSFVGSKSVTFTASRWATPWLSGSLTALAASDCLQMWSWLEKTTLDKPSRCRQRRSVLTLAPDLMFWKQSDFEVRQGDVVLTLCLSSDSQCEFALPGSR